MGEVRAGGMIADVSADLNAGGLEITELVSRLRGGDIRALARAGVTQFNIYLMCGDEEDTLEKYKKEILPAFREAS